MLYAKIRLTEDITLAIPQRYRNNSWPAGTEFYIRQTEPEWGMVVSGPHPDAGLGVAPESAEIIQRFNSYDEMRQALIAEREASWDVDA